MRLRLAAALLLSVTATPGLVRAQVPIPRRPVDSYPGGSEGRSGPSDLKAALASALVPGAGQWLQGRRWWLAFAAIEAAAWYVRIDANGDGRRFRSAYHDLAWSAARGSPTPRLDGDFEYYETMSHWARSGAYDADPGTGGVQPERDPETYNGAQWELAAEIYLQGDVEAEPGSPGYQSALDYYNGRAYPGEMLWDWEGAPDDLDRFRSLIDDSDRRFRRASTALGIVIANHVLAAVDAFAWARMGRDGRLRSSVEVLPARRGRGADLTISIPLR